MSVSALLNGFLDINVKGVTTNNVEGNSGNLSIEGTTTFQDNNHIGRVIIPNGATVSNSEPINNMNNDAVILITSKHPNTGIWVEPTDGSFTVHTSVAVVADTTVNYFVLKAD